MVRLYKPLSNILKSEEYEDTIEINDKLAKHIIKYFNIRLNGKVKYLYIYKSGNIIFIHLLARDRITLSTAYFYLPKFKRRRSRR